MAKPIAVLMQKEMSRKEFLATLGFGLAAIMGFSSIIHLLTGKSLSHSGIQSRGIGYGATPYGGGQD
jgi:hypothetical protein